ncbi:DNA single-strand annealing protein RecT-like protein [Burkholderia pseudomallei]|uniref:hypothetical protein n=1 Tax=Burkholderia pseudomallei TaxID=28450 RepID=UPI0005DE31CA|nr:hypothetical protein [Burkholderia pseudomallei]CAJ9927848.1 DNA single-strand annealing protein RecT-like protein [Burkholderia pseudomallei]CAK1307371.1 DNA single-strand annealing protein RecT-like protein [Burkholderia pseudomallei]CPG55203.1 DNA single-strand annealing protein RecT-like protein [Burkholderia pseudomallei]
MNELVASPFGNRSTAVADTAGARQDQSRELAETQVKYLMAQQFPRDVIANTDKILNAFTRPTLAEQSQYQFSRGGSDISGPSIRAAEAMAQQWGNIEQGFRERSRGVDGKGVPFSEVEAFCVDLESRTTKRLQFIVRHWRDTKSGGYQLKDERDIYELIANQAQRRVRACILALIPGDVVDAAMQQAAVTLNAKADTSPEAVQKIIAAFDGFGVTKEHIEKRIQRRLDAITPAQVVTLKRIYASLRDGMSGPEEWFEMGEPQAAAGETTTLKDIAARGAARKPKKPADEVPPPPDSPIIDEAEMLRRIESCTDVDVLDLCVDEVRDYPDDVRARLTEAYNQRRETLLGA